MRVRTPAIRCDRPTVQGLPAFSPAQCPRVGGKLILPQRTFSCDAKDQAHLRKYLGKNTFSNHGVQVEHKVFQPGSPSDVRARNPPSWATPRRKARLVSKHSAGL